jgi:hypothetical protein
MRSGRKQKTTTTTTRNKTEELNNQNVTTGSRRKNKISPERQSTKVKGKDTQPKPRTIARNQNRSSNMETSSVVVRSVKLIAPPSLVVTL